jgi:hypothetical protein
VLRHDSAGRDDYRGAEAGQGCLFGTWQLADGTQVRGRLASARYAPT